MKQPPRNHQAFLVGTALGLIIGVLVLDLIFPTGVVPGVLYVSLAMLSLAAPRRGVPFLTATAFMALIAYDLASTFLTLQDIPWPILARTAFLLLAVWVPVGVSLVTQKVEERIELINTPLHLCPSCKKLRDDEGLWSRIEDYVMTEMGRETAPGFCPNCVVKWTVSRAQRYS